MLVYTIQIYDSVPIYTRLEFNELRGNLLHITIIYDVPVTI